MDIDIEFRPARPEDAELALPLLYSSSPVAYEYLFGPPAENTRAFLRDAFERDAGFLGHGVHTVAVVAGRVVGVGAFYSGADLSGLMPGAFARIFSHYGLGAVRVVTRLARLSRVTRAPERDTHFVTNLGVAPDLRGRGIGAAILRHEMGAARRLGRRRLGLDVAVDNPNAERLYTRLGFAVTKERQPSAHLAAAGIPAVRRMELAL
jgi:ribosomal protein S18 acetylase RimI-like enzyme